MRRLGQRTTAAAGSLPEPFPSIVPSVNFRATTPQWLLSLDNLRDRVLPVEECDYSWGPWDVTCDRNKVKVILCDGNDDARAPKTNEHTHHYSNSTSHSLCQCQAQQLVPSPFSTGLMTRPTRLEYYLCKISTLCNCNSTRLLSRVKGLTQLVKADLLSATYSTHQSNLWIGRCRDDDKTFTDCNERCVARILHYDETESKHSGKKDQGFGATNSWEGPGNHCLDWRFLPRLRVAWCTRTAGG